MISNDKEYYLKKHLPFFNSLSELEINNLINSSFIKKYNKGELIQSKDSTCTGLVLVLNGQIRSFMSSSLGKEITLFRLFEFDTCMLSASCAYPNLTHTINLITEEITNVLIIDSTFFKEISNDNINIQKFILNLTQDKLSQIMWVLEQVVFFNLDARLSSFLLNEYYLNNSTNIKITHDCIANNLGSAREVISRMLKRFESDNLIQLSRGCIKLIKLDELQLLSNKI